MTGETMPSITRLNPPELGTPPGYSQIVEVTARRIIFIAGQTALDADGHLIGKNDFAAQASQKISPSPCAPADARQPIW